ncbi:hypothetical protein FPCIR_3952 [Fusarium pseudocircinatum]|uniref:Uncharacterized protein n=1 Tax=Fusarium pseudocircinatum TaxID=56676 RepID=A0A8H5PH55_9HYPO|nr:hypothetical protein FPCIR_3952 [Fusarium pseudocircinatum]
MDQNPFTSPTMPSLPALSLPVTEDECEVLTLCLVSNLSQYEVGDFLSHLKYQVGIAQHTIAEFDSNVPPDWKKATPAFHTNNPLQPRFKTFEALKDGIMWMASEVNNGIAGFIRENRVEPSGRVPSASLREVRLWVQLNTQPERVALEAKDLTFEQVRAILIGLEPKIKPNFNILDTEYGEIPEEEVPKKKKKNLPKKGPTAYEVALGQRNVSEQSQKLLKKGLIDVKIDHIFPMVIFVCSGAGLRNGVLYIIHHSYAFGGTQERLASWASMYKIRLDARNAHVGAVDQGRWVEAYGKLDQYDKDAASQGFDQTTARRHLAELTLSVNGGPTESEMTPLASSASPAALRDVLEHIGLPFNVYANKVKPSGCCYGCKATVRYVEAMTTDALIQDIKSTSGSTKFEHRNEAWSCAEVLSSLYCQKAHMSLVSGMEDVNLANEAKSK